MIRIAQSMTVMVVAMALVATLPSFMTGVAMIAEQTQLQFVDHAILKHGLEAELVSQCINNKGELLKWRQLNGNIAKVCQLDDGRFGIQVETPNGVRITAFIKNKMKTIDQVLKYLSNKGGTIIP